MSASPSTSSSTALVAFLRGIEPRARVLARAQAGPALDDQRLLALVRGEFEQRAPRLPLAEWPLRYWGLLLARDELARPLGQTPPHPLYALAHTRRLALLLRLVVGMEPAGAARVLGLSETAYRALWADAEDKLAERGVTAAVLMRWQDEFQREVRGESAAPASAADVSSRDGVRRPVPMVPPRSRWRPSGLQWGLGLVMLLLLGVLGATFVWPPSPTSGPAAPVTAPAVLEPQSTTNARDFEAELVVDPDFALLASPPQAAWREGVAFLSWWTAAQATALPAPDPGTAPSAPDWSTLPPETRRLLGPVEGAWSALDASARADLLANAEAWQALDRPGRQALLAAYAEWLERPALERSTLRSAFAEWTALDRSERDALAAAATAFAALPAAEQQAQRSAFAALDAQAQRDWALGPRLGAQLPGLRPLLAYVPAGEQAALIDALEALGDEARQALATRVATMGTAERAALRGRVLAAPPEARPGLLAEAAAPR